MGHSIRYVSSSITSYDILSLTIYSMSRNIRQTALAKLVALSATSQPGTLASSDIDRLSEAVSKRWQGVGSSSKIPEGYSGISSVPMVGDNSYEILNGQSAMPHKLETF